MVESIILGILQGITEWLPISSDSVLVLTQLRFFGESSFLEATRYSLFLHGGTFLAAFVYLRKDVFRLFSGIFSQEKYNKTKNEIVFYILVTLISGALGGLLLLGVVKGLEELHASVEMTGRIITFLTGILLFGTAVSLMKKKWAGTRLPSDLSKKDSIILGIAQGLSVLPGLSRSGLTVAALLLRKFDDTAALKISFLMSLPIVLAGNIVLNFDSFFFSSEALLGVVTAFVVGLITMSSLLAFARRVSFVWFVFVFGVITIAAAFI